MHAKLFSKINCSKILGLYCVLLSFSAFPSINLEKSTLFTLKIYFEPYKQKKLNYLMFIPEGYYSYYLGSDLPQWQVIPDRVINNEFLSGQLVNIRVHADKYRNDLLKKKIASLMIIDPEYSRVIWQGEFNYENPHKIKIINKINNKKFYDTQLKFQKETRTIYLQTVSQPEKTVNYQN